MTSATVKRLADIVLGLVVLVVSAPVQAGVAILVGVALGRPVLFRQERVGMGGRSFTLYKFRTMRALDPDRGLVDDASRMTTVGRVLRSTSLDELPTFWNVVRGDMSLVGPRPLLPDYLPLYTQVEARRHLVRPGVTGLAQVSGRNELPWGERLAADVWYVDHRSFLLDLRILLQTVLVVTGRRGISQAGSVTSTTLTDHRAHERGAS